MPRTQFALDDSLYFSTVEVRQKTATPKTTPCPSARGRTESPASLSHGYGTDNVRGTIAREDRRVNQRGHWFRTEIQASLAQSLTRYTAHRRSGHENSRPPTGEHQRLADTTSIRSISPSARRCGVLSATTWQRVTYLELPDTKSEFIASWNR